MFVKIKLAGFYLGKRDNLLLLVADIQLYGAVARSDYSRQAAKKKHYLNRLMSAFFHFNNTSTRHNDVSLVPINSSVVVFVTIINGSFSFYIPQHFRLYTTSDTEFR